MNIPFKPTRGRILVQKVALEEKTAGGIFIPETFRDSENRGQIVRAGEGVTIPEGSIISYRDDAGRPLTVQGQEYLLMFENDVDGIYEG